MTDRSKRLEEIERAKESLARKGQGCVYCVELITMAHSLEKKLEIAKDALQLVSNPPPIFADKYIKIITRAALRVMDDE